MTTSDVTPPTARLMKRSYKHMDIIIIAMCSNNLPHLLENTQPVQSLLSYTITISSSYPVASVPQR